jgi:hypothetical protein
VPNVVYDAAYKARPDRHARLTLMGDRPFGFLVVYTAG